VGDYAYLFGGEFKIEPYKLDLHNMIWSRIQYINYNHYCHSASVIGENVYLFGGIEIDDDIITNDLLVFFTQQEELKKPVT